MRRGRQILFVKSGPPLCVRVGWITKQPRCDFWLPLSNPRFDCCSAGFRWRTFSRTLQHLYYLYLCWMLAIRESHGVDPEFNFDLRKRLCFIARVRGYLQFPSGERLCLKCLLSKMISLFGRCDKFTLYKYEWLYKE